MRPTEATTNVVLNLALVHETFQRTMATAAREAGIGVLGGVIALDPRTGRRSNRALLLDAGGREVATYEKLHLPSEEGFCWSEIAG